MKRKSVFWHGVSRWNALFFSFLQIKENANPVDVLL